jgi:hypothetical protein
MKARIGFLITVFSPVAPLLLFFLMSMKIDIPSPYFAPLALGSLISPCLGVLGFRMIEDADRKKLGKGLTAVAFIGMLLVVFRLANG